MSDNDYIYDKKGPPDPDVAKLEGLLGGLRFDRPPPVPRRSRRPFFVAAAVAMAAAAALILWVKWPRAADDQRVRAGLPDVGGGWSVESLAGRPTCGDAPCSILRPGDWLETDGEARARVMVADIGEMDVQPGSRLRLVATGPERHHLELREGTIDAVVTAPPRLLVVDTPTTTAVDLGCAYRLTVDAGGRTRISVSSGFVALEAPGRVTIVPAGASASSSRGSGPGLPVFDDARADFIAAADRLDADPGDARALDTVLLASRKRDSLTLWHLLPRVADGQPRMRLIDRLSEIRRPASREALMRLDPAALEEYRHQLDTPDSGSWQDERHVEPPNRK